MNIRQLNDRPDGKKYYHSEAYGVYKGFTYQVIFFKSGYRCGYVRIPKTIKLSETDFSYNSPFDVHGGISYVNSDFDYQVLGFDTAHVFDKPDVDKLVEYFGIDQTTKDMGKVRTLEYTVQQCKYLIDQIIEKYKED